MVQCNKFMKLNNQKYNRSRHMTGAWFCLFSKLNMILLKIAPKKLERCYKWLKACHNAQNDQSKHILLKYLLLLFDFVTYYLEKTKHTCNFSIKSFTALTLLHSERPKLYTILALLSAIRLKWMGILPCLAITFTEGNNFCDFQLSYRISSAIRRVFPFSRMTTNN